MTNNQQERDLFRQQIEKIEQQKSKFEKQLGHDEEALTRKEIMEARGME